MLAMQIFTFKKVDSPRLLQESFKVRYQVYCKERNFISEEDCPQRSERDKFDDHSLHFVALDSQESVVGTVRLILPTSLAFPIEQFCPHVKFRDLDIDRDKAAEVSRLVISKILRRRVGSELRYVAGITNGQLKSGNNRELSKHIMPMAFGLYRELYQESIRNGIRYWFALMEKKLWLLSKMHGIIFKPIGEKVNCFGLVQPYVADLFQIKRIPTNYFWS